MPPDSRPGPPAESRYCSTGCAMWAESGRGQSRASRRRCTIRSRRSNGASRIRARSAGRWHRATSKPPAHAVSRFEHADQQARRRQPSRRREPGRARSDQMTSSSSRDRCFGRRADQQDWKKACADLSRFAGMGRRHIGACQAALRATMLGRANQRPAKSRVDRPTRSRERFAYGRARAAGDGGFRT
jgi:hypothetical protein